MSDVTDAAMTVAAAEPALTHEGVVAKVARWLGKEAHEVRGEILAIADDLGLHHPKPTAAPEPEPASPAPDAPSTPATPPSGAAPETVTP